MGNISQKDMVLNWLMTRVELTTRDAVLELNILCLPKRISELRRDGYPISTKYRTAPSGKKYGVYRLEETA